MFDPEHPPELATVGWLNTPEPLTLAKLKGKVVAITAFQMLCRGSMEHGLPQAKRHAAKFNAQEVAVIGLHSVFEHHAAMTPEALQVFIAEYQWPFPIGIDAPNGAGVGGGAPKTMTAYQMQGTPTLLLFDRGGRLRRHYFGRPDDMQIAAEIMALAIEDAHSPRDQAAAIEHKIGRTLATPAHNHDHGEPGHVHGPDCGHDHGRG